MAETASPEQQVNSVTYWDRRFESDWEAKGGREQSRVFMEMAVAYLPLVIYEEIAASGLSLLDCGCAEGDGTALLAQRFPRSAVAGCDFSLAAIQRARVSYPGVEFFQADLTGLDRQADVLISSNCFEHLERPATALRQMLRCAGRYVVLLVPFLETYPYDPEHVRVVHSATFPEQLAGWRLRHRIVLPPSHVWSGSQLLLIYEPERAAEGERERLPVNGASSSTWGGEPAAAPLELDLESQRHRLAAAEEKLASLHDFAGRQESELVRLRNERRQRAEDHTSFHRSYWQLAGRHRALAAERDALAEEHGRLAHEHGTVTATMAAYESSRAFRLVSSFWRLVNGLLPAGSRRRRLYGRLMRSVRRRQAAHAAAEPVPAPAATAAPSAAPVPAWRAELSWFAGEVARLRAPAVAVLFAGSQLRENEGQRPTQLALELSRRGIPVVFAYFRWERQEWRPQDRLGEGILQLPLDVAIAEPGLLAGAFASPHRIAFFEFPYPNLFEVVAAFNGAGWITAYDILDDWEQFHQGGQAVWYDEGFERHLLTAVDAVFAVHPALAKRALTLGASQVEVVPNGLRSGIEAVSARRPLERGEVTVGYFGYLSEAWFDWELMLEAARRRPTWRFYLIGYGCDVERLGLPANLVWLGKQPQSELAAYAANWDVAVVPFKPGPLAAAADPIKVYEYLAMGLPVVTTGVTPPAGGEGLVVQADGLAQFLQRLDEAARTGYEGAARRRAFAATATWERRVDALLATLESDRQRVAEKRTLFAERR